MPKPHTPKFYLSSSSEKGKYLLERGDAEKEKLNIASAIKYYEEARKYCNDEAQKRLEKINPVFAQGNVSTPPEVVDPINQQFQLSSPYFPAMPFPSGSSFDSIDLETSLSQATVHYAIQDTPSTLALANMFRNANDEKKKQINNTINQMIHLFDETSASLESIQELAVLASIPDQRIFIAIINQLLKVEKESPTFPELTIYGIAVILTAAPKEIDLQDRQGLFADVLERLQLRLQRTRQVNNNEELLPLLRALSALLDAMLCRNMKSLSRVDVYNPMNDVLYDLASNDNIHPEVSFLARYASQSLAYIGNDESLGMSIFRRGRLAIGVIVDIKSAVLDFDLGAFESIYEKIISMSDVSIKMEWYQGLLFLDCLLANNDLSNFEKFVIESKLSTNEYFMQGVCLRLELIISLYPNRDVIHGAQRFLQSLVPNPLQGIQSMAVMVLERSNSTSTRSDSTLTTAQFQKTETRLKPVSDKSWYTDNSSHLLKLVQDALRIESNNLNLEKIIPTQSAMSEVNQALMDYYSSQLTIRRVSGDILSLESCYVNLAIVEAKAQREKNKQELDDQKKNFIRMPSFEEHSSTNKEKSIPLEEILNRRTLLNGGEGKPKRILVIGRAGVGKTTFCKKLVHIFQQGQWNDRYDAILWLPLRLLKGYKSRILEEFLIEWYFNNRVKNEREGLAREFIKSAEKGRVLFVLDGLDEFVTDSDSKDGNPLKTLIITLLNQQNVIITTRPYGIDRTLLRDLDLELETVGFSTDNVEQYVKSNVEDIGDSKSVLNFIQQTPLIQGLVNIPIQLDLICFSWRDLVSSTESATITQLYDTIVRKLWCSDAVRMRKEIEGNVASEDLFDNLLPDSVDMFMAPINEYLGYLAFQGLKDNHQLVFDKKILMIREQELSRHRKSMGQSALPLNFLGEVKKSSILHKPDLGSKLETWNFIHLTFQEYFAAKWLSQYFQQEQSITSNHSKLMDIDGTIAFIQRNKYNPRFEIVWWMIAGQLEGEALESYFRLLQAAPRDLIGIRHQLLISGCFKEASSKLSEETSNQIRDDLSQWLRFELYLLHLSEYSKSALTMKSEFPEEILIKTIGGTGNKYDDVRILEALQNRKFLKPSTIEDLILKSKGDNSDIINYVYPMLEDQPNFSDSAITVLVTSLQHEDKYVRKSAVEILGRLSSLPLSTITKLVTAMQNEEWEVRCAATDSLGNQSSLPELALTALVTALDDEDYNVAVRAADALKKQSLLPDFVVTTIVAALQSEKQDTRRLAVDVLEKQQSLSDSTIIAVAATLQDEEYSVRQAATLFFGNQLSFTDSVITALVTALQDEDSYVRKMAAFGLGKQYSLAESTITSLVMVLQDENDDVRVTAVESLGNQLSMSDSTTAALFAILQDEDENVRGAVVNVLEKHSRLSDPTITTAITDLRDENWNVRCRAAIALATQSSSFSDSVIAALVTSLKDENWNIRHSTAFGLRMQSSLPDSIIAALVNVLQDEAHQVRKAAADALANQSSLSDSTITALGAALQDENQQVRRSVAEVLKNQSTLSDPSITELIKALRDECEDVQNAAAEALIKQSPLSDEKITALITALQDESGPVRKVAAYVFSKQLSLSDSTTTTLVAALQDENYYVRYQVARALSIPSSFSDSAIDALVNTLQAGDIYARQKAMEVLGRIPEMSDSVIASLVTALEDDYQDVIYSASWALGSQSSLPDSLLFRILTLSLYDMRNMVALYDQIGFQRISFFLKSASESEIKVIYKKVLFYYCLLHHAAIFIHENQLQIYSENGFDHTSELESEVLDMIRSAFISVQQEGGIQRVDHY